MSNTNLFSVLIAVVCSGTVGASGIALAATGPSGADSSLPAADVDLEGVAFVRGEVLVRYRDGLASPKRPEIETRHRLQVLTESRLGNFVHYAIPPDETVTTSLARLRAEGGIILAQPNYLYAAAGWPQDPYFRDAPSAPNQWGLFATKVPSLWRARVSGAGQVIAIIDSGVKMTHPDLPNFWINPGEVPGNGDDDDDNGFIDDFRGWDFQDADNDPSDVFGHGTMVAGIACAVSDPLGVVGVAYGAAYMAVRVLDETGLASSVQIVPGVAYAARSGADILNLSWTIQYDPDDPDADCLLHEAVAEAIELGCVVVGAAGNNDSQVRAPALYEGVIAVGASDPGGGVWSLSNHGDALDVVAPGVDIYSTTITGAGYDKATGTSYAAPFVSGLCALLREFFPGTRPWELEDFLRKQTRNLDGLPPGSGSNGDGYGLVCFGSMRDYGNAPFLNPAWSNNTFFEWLGNDVSGESSTSDATGDSDGDDYQPDLDGRPNDTGHDAADDGFFPASFRHLPLLPAHLAAGSRLDVVLSVGDWMGPRYSSGQELAFRTWIDWNSDRALVDGTELALSSTSAPLGWGANTRREVRPRMLNNDDHYQGNPLRTRTRVVHEGSDGLPPRLGGSQFGEVEDQEVLNFIEDCDITFHVTAPVLFADLTGGWAIAPDAEADPDLPAHRGTWHYLRDIASGECNGHITDTATFPQAGAPALDLTEVTACSLSVWLSHCNWPCGSGAADLCRIEILHSTDSGGGFIPTEIYNPPDPECPHIGGTVFTDQVVLDLSDFIGEYIRVRIVDENIDMYHHAVQADDIFVWGYDNKLPVAPTMAGAALSPSRNLSFNWVNRQENPTVGPSEPTIELYGCRLSVGGNWSSAFPLTPRDFGHAGGAFPPPGPVGSGGATALAAPSVFPSFTVRLRAEDELANRGSEGTRTCSTAPSFDVLLDTEVESLFVAPGDTLRFAAVVQNVGNALDAISLHATDDTDWLLCPDRWVHVLDAGELDVDSVGVGVPLDAEDGMEDLIELVALSLSSAAAVDIRQVRLIVDDPVPPCAHLGEHDAGAVRHSVTDRGCFGFDSSMQEQGAGFVYPSAGGLNRLFIGSLWLGTGPSYMLNRDFQMDPQPELEALDCLVQEVDEGLDPPLADEIWRGSIGDQGHPSPLGLQVRQRTYAWADADNDDFIFVVYETVNPTPDPVPNLWIGQFMDWDLEEMGENRGASDANRDLVYMWRDGGGDGTRVGVKALSHRGGLQMNFVHNPTYIYPLQYLTDVDRFHFVSGDDPAYVVRSTPESDDWSAVLGIGPFYLASGDTLRVAFALVAGPSDAGIKAHADAAQALWEALFGGTTAAPVASSLPLRSELHPPAPNPFAVDTSLRFDVPRAADLTLEVFDVAGRRVAGLLDGRCTPGRHEARWDGRSEGGHLLASGVYYARLRLGGREMQQKLVLRR